MISTSHVLHAVAKVRCSAKDAEVLERSKAKAAIAHLIKCHAYPVVALAHRTAELAAGAEWSFLISAARLFSQTKQYQ